MTIFIETERTVIKVPVLNDVTYWSSLHSDHDVMEYMGGIKTKEVVQAWLEADIQHFKKHGFGMGSVFERNSNEFIGKAGLVYLDHDDHQPDIEIGYVLHKHFWSKGYGTELVHALVNWGFNHLSVNKLVAVTRPENEKSKCLLEKCGMRHLKNITLHGSIFLLYGILKSEQN